MALTRPAGRSSYPHARALPRRVLSAGPPSGTGAVTIRSGWAVSLSRVVECATVCEEVMNAERQIETSIFVETYNLLGDPAVPVARAAGSVAFETGTDVTSDEVLSVRPYACDPARGADAAGAPALGRVPPITPDRPRARGPRNPEARERWLERRARRERLRRESSATPRP